MKHEDIKFKAWDKKEKKMYIVSILDLEQNEIRVKDEKDFFSVINNVPENKDNLSKDIVLLPFSGFRDKNGTEIYEGDIIRIDKDSDKYMICKRFMGFGYKKLNSGECDFLPDCELSLYIENNMVTVIGNVWENPELLKG